MWKSHFFRRLEQIAWSDIAYFVILSRDFSKIMNVLLVWVDRCSFYMLACRSHTKACTSRSHQTRGVASRRVDALRRASKRPHLDSWPLYAYYLARRRGRCECSLSLTLIRCVQDATMRPRRYELGVNGALMWLKMFANHAWHSSI